MLDCHSKWFSRIVVPGALVFLACDTNLYAQDDCFPDLPAPVLTYEGFEVETNGVRFWLNVSNYSEFPDVLFESRDDLGPCGMNNTPARTWVEVFDQDDQFINRFCALGSASSLQEIWTFAADCDSAPEMVYIRLIDRLCDLEYTSNMVPLSCQTASLDIKPGSCPNSFNRRSRGVLPVALVGTASFDVTMVDLGSITLSRADGLGGSVAPLEGPPGPHTMIEDVTEVFDGDACGCDETFPDGIMDLSFKFRSDEVTEVLELGDLTNCDPVELVLQGTLLDGTAFAASDCLRLVPPGDTNGDCQVGVTDLITVLSTWGNCLDLPADCKADFNGTQSVDVADLLILLNNWR